MTNLGVYYPTDSFWHRIDPRCKLLVVLFVMVLGWMVCGFGWLILFALLVWLFLSSQLPFKLPCGLLWKFKWLLVITFIVNLPVPVINDNMWATLNRNFLPALALSGRLGIMFVIAVWLSWVTRPLNLIEGISRLLKPLARFKAPVIDIPLMMMLVLRFIPELMAASEEIMVAQRLRGIKPNLSWKNSRLWVQSTIIPLFISTIRKSVSMAFAMESRGFRPGAPRTSTEELAFHTRDYIVTGLVGIIIVLWLAKRFIIS